MSHIITKQELTQDKKLIKIIKNSGLDEKLEEKINLLFNTCIIETNDKIEVLNNSGSDCNNIIIQPHNGSEIVGIYLSKTKKLEFLKSNKYFTEIRIGDTSYKIYYKRK